MDMNNGVNPAQSDTVRGQLQIDEATEKVVYHREPPPSYDTVFSNDVTVAPVTNEPVARNLNLSVPLKSSPVSIYCTKCDRRVVTEISHSSTQKTHMLAGFLCGFTCWCCLCCIAAIPYLTKSFKESQHSCPHCKSFFGTYSLL